MSAWRQTLPKGSKEQGAQIDLLFDRSDGAITICDAKYSDQKFTVDKPTAKNLANKIEVFEKHTNTRKEIFLALITTMGLKKSIWSEELINNVVTLDDLFSEE